MLAPAAVVNNLAEKVEECPLTLYIVCVFRGVEVYGEMVRTFRMLRVSGKQNLPVNSAQNFFART